ncbi:Asp23/Gls24 family envelope stress response protein [Streptomyces himalayensis]|uniref:Asp23/Gls24 family envelope stress response protein n=2 Tax=Streptomyces himalayensis TaxID=2820085 RepID=A0A7W2CVE4_9ACTN|nr:Asp23/Gls24 family envelope stress response protein [Streptomyces himalayensis]MBA2948427.1 Asp23/Gls24 family envelope stress response protein [Streptomyces himalayensis subsp. himalayensis]MBA4859833.1 Asp23/Gls24 family envelope stress response protein [Streptomyces himalayensis subsp. aureolus]
MTPLPGQSVEPAERGATRIADRVVAKIAAWAAREALDAVPQGGEPPHATVTVHQETGRVRTARVRISLELDYPSDIGRQCGAVRRHVAERVKTLAGMEVPEVAVQVERLHSAHARSAAQGRTR